jgi:hypothetical protein
MKEQQIVMLDPATDDVLSVCSGPAADGRCPVADAPPYVCAGLHLARRLVDETLAGSPTTDADSD